MYLSSRGTETVLGNTSQPGEKALMTAGQAQIQVITASTTKAALRRYTGLAQTQEHLPRPIREGLAHSAVSGEAWRE